MQDRILLTVAARGGSKGVKNKNIRDLNGLPLIAHTINQAIAWGKADSIVCSTDSQDIADVAREYGAQVPFMRPEHLAEDTSGKRDVLKHALKYMEDQTLSKFNILIDLDATAPIRTLSDLDGSLELFKEKQAKCVFSVTPARKNPYFNMVELDANNVSRLSKNLKKPLVRRQDAPKVFDMNASIYIYDREFLLDEKSDTVFSDQSYAWVMDEISAFDIDTEQDFRFLEFLTKEQLVQL